MEFWDEYEIEKVEEKDLSYYRETPVKIKGLLSRIMFPKYPTVHESGEYAIVKIAMTELLEGELHPRALDKKGTVSIKGNMQKLEYGDEYEFTILLDEVHETYGASYNLSFSRQDFDFTNEKDSRIFLSKILTDNQVEELYKVFNNPIEIIENKDIESLIKVKGIGESIAQKIITKFEHTKDYALAYVELNSYDLTINAINLLVDKYGSPNILVELIKENPYMLTEVDGYGFKKADNIALKGGIDKNSVQRVMAFIDYVLLDLGENGNSWIESDHLIYLIEENLGEIEMSIIVEAVNKLKDLHRLWNEKRGLVGSMKFYKLELKIVKELYRLMNAPKASISIGWEDRIKQAEILQGWEYTDEQKEAIELILNNNVCILTGHSGTGKSSTVLGAVKALGDVSFGQCALSGKASSRLEEVTGYKSSTIHRLLGFTTDSNGKRMFSYDKNFQLSYDVVILDEASMVGGELFYSLIQAIQSGSRFILIGDIKQVPPINSLNVFYDCLESGIVPQAQLTKIHRQASKSGIITNSISLSGGNQLVEKDFEGKETRGELQDFHLDIYDKKQLTYNRIIETFKEKLEIAKDHTKVQVIVPFNLNGEVSVYSLNKTLQEICNPESEDKKERRVIYSKNKDAILREGDLVMNTVNNYKLESPLDKNWNETIEVSVFNGFIGELKEIRGDDLLVYFPLLERDVIIPKSHWQGKRAIQHSWTATCHKYQGSQNDYIIVAIDYSHYVLLTNEWVYTAITRASKDCTLIAQNSALQYAINTKEARNKQTFMPTLLRELGGNNE